MHVCVLVLVQRSNSFFFRRKIGAQCQVCVEKENQKYVTAIAHDWRQQQNIVNILDINVDNDKKSKRMTITKSRYTIEKKTHKKQQQ